MTPFSLQSGYRKTGRRLAPASFIIFFKSSFHLKADKDRTGAKLRADECGGTGATRKKSVD